MKGSLKVLSGGLFTTIQDFGRKNYRKFGIPVSGVMDTHSYRLANWLAGNESSAPVLEMTLQGGSYEFNTDAVTALTGADMNAKLNDQKLEMNATVVVREGDVLSLGYAKSGCRSYFAIHGSWNKKKIMDSYSTYTLARIGGLEGRKLKKGDVLNWEYGALPKEKKEIPKKLIPYYSSSGNKIRIIKGPEWDWLSQKNQEFLLQNEFTISSQSNRMGIRLQSDKSLRGKGEEMITSAIIPGIIQMPTGGNPIILMQDAQTAGGYPRIAKVIDADLWRLAQLAPQASLSFKMIEVEEAKQLWEYLAGLYDLLIK